MAKEMADFVARVEAYDRLRQKLTDQIPSLSDSATPQELDTYQRKLAALVVAARPNAKQGELFAPEMQTIVRTLMARVFKDPADRAELRNAIAEDNPQGVKVNVNGRYPDAVPLATMPPEVLKNLPPLPKDFEYRFVGESLILLDTRAHLVVDFMALGLPRD